MCFINFRTMISEGISWPNFQSHRARDSRKNCFGLRHTCGARWISVFLRSIPSLTSSFAPGPLSSRPGAQPHSLELGLHVAMVREVPGCLACPAVASLRGPQGTGSPSSPWRLVLPWCPGSNSRAGPGQLGVWVAQGLWGQQAGPRAAQGHGELCGG